MGSNVYGRELNTKTQRHEGQLVELRNSATDRFLFCDLAFAIGEERKLPRVVLDVVGMA